VKSRASSTAADETPSSNQQGVSENRKGLPNGSKY